MPHAADISCADCQPPAGAPQADWFVGRIFDTSDFPPRWHCGTWSELHGWMHIGADLGVASAYLAIPLCLLFFVLRRRDVPFRAIFLLFIAFILSCGIGHLIEASIFWWPAYRFAGVWKVGTALISWATVVALVRVAPAAMELPGLRAANEQLAGEVERRRCVERALVCSNDRLRDFGVIASHDLREPLRAMSMAMQLVSADERGLSATQQELVTHAIGAAGRMQTMIDRLMEHTRVGQSAHLGSSTSLAAGVDAVRGVLAQRIAEVGARIELEADMDVGMDETDLQLLLQNLVSNSLKYRRDDRAPVVRVSGEQAGGVQVITVDDNGVGIEPAHRQEVFELFRRFDSAEEEPGSGVGLATCRRVAEVYGGTIGIEDGPLGGARIRVLLPVRRGTAT